MTNCECPVSGFCKRHNVEKTPHLWTLCRTKEEYFEAWEKNYGPGQLKSDFTKTRKKMAVRKINLKKIGRKLWNNLFERVTNLNLLSHWEKTIPNFSCECASFYYSWKKINPPEIINNQISLYWKWKLKMAVNQKLQHPNISFEECKNKYRYELRDQNIHFITSYKELVNDSIQLAELIYHDHPNITGIAGVPRSGMIPASIIAQHLGIDLYECPTSMDLPLRKATGGVRQTDSPIHGKRFQSSQTNLVIVDDSTCSGYAYHQQAFRQLPFYTVYAGSPGKSLVDGYAVPMELPHFFEWNIFHNGNIMGGMRAGFDMDGVFCMDCPPEADDDGMFYDHWLKTVRPLQLSLEFQIPLIVTARRECYRPQTMEWLHRHRIRVKDLVMFPGSFAERQTTNIGSWKASIAKHHNCALFVESNYAQAIQIKNDYPSCHVISIERPSNFLP